MGFQRGHLRSLKRSKALPTRAARVGAAAALCGLVLAGGHRAGAWAPAEAAPAVSDKTISLSIANADIRAVVNDLQSRTKFNVVVVEGDRPYKLVTLALNHVNFDTALRYVAASAGASVTVNPDGVYVLSPLSSAPGEQPAAAQTAALSQPPPPAPDAPRPVYTQHKLFLKYIAPDDILRYFKLDQADNASADVGTPGVSRLRGSSGNRFSAFGQGQGVNVLPLVSTVVQNGGPYQQPSVPAGQGLTGPNQANDYQSANRSLDPTDPQSQAHQFGFPGGGFGGGGQFGGGGFGGGGQFGGGGFGGGGFGGNQFGGGGGFGGNQFGAGGGLPGGGQFGGAGGQLGQQRLALPDGVDRVYANEGDNSLLVYATVDGFNFVKEIVKELDVKARQVQIKVEFVTAQVVDVDQFGVNLSFIPTPTLGVSLPTANNNPYTGGALAGVQNLTSNVIQFAYGNVAAELFALLQKTRSKLVSAPLVSTTNNVTADVLFDQQIPFTTTNTTIVPNGGTVTTNTLSVQDIITDLPVTPRINADDTVTMTLTPVISTPAPGATGGGSNSGTGTGTGTTGTGTGTTGTGTGAGTGTGTTGTGTGTTGTGGTNGGAVATNTQQINVTRTVHSGETMVIGGLVSKTENYYQSKVPILGDLPIIGSLFRSRSKNNNDSELLIFVTPTIIEDDADNGLTSAPQGRPALMPSPAISPIPAARSRPERPPS